MTRTVTSPVARWPGAVTLKMPTWDLAARWARAVRDTDGELSALEYHNGFLPCILAWVEKWELGGGFPAAPTLETFPVKPLGDALQLVGWLTGEINRLLLEDETPDPKA